MAILLRFHKDTSERGEPVEYVVLAAGGPVPYEKYQEEFGEAGYQMDVFIVHPQNDWDSSLPTDRHLVERRYQSVNISGSVVGDITQIGKVVRR